MSPDVLQVVHFPRRKPGRGLLAQMWSARWLYLLAIPAVIWIIVFRWSLLPYLYMACIRFQPMKGLWDSPFIGFDNFVNVLKNALLLDLIWHAVYINLGKMIFGTTMAIILALSLNEVKRNGFKRVVQTMTYLPHFMTWILVGGLMYNFLGRDSGIINNILVNWFHQSPVSWYIEGQNWPAILVITHIWKEVGFGSILYLAMIAGINPEIYEAAFVDGATKFQQIRYITLPNLVPVIGFTVVMQFASILGTDVTQWFALVGNSATVLPYVDTIDYVTFRAVSVSPILSGTQVGGAGGLATLGFPYLTALGFMLACVVVVMTFTGNALAKRLTNWTGLF